VGTQTTDETHWGVWLWNSGFSGRTSAVTTTVTAVTVAVATVATITAAFSTLVTAGLKTAVPIPRATVVPGGAVILDGGAGRKVAVLCNVFRIDSTIVARRTILIVVGVVQDPLLVLGSLVDELPGLLNCVDVMSTVRRGGHRGQVLETLLELVRSCGGSCGDLE
jgi:hypothetical protein